MKSKSFTTLLLLLASISVLWAQTSPNLREVPRKDIVEDESRILYSMDYYTGKDFVKGDSITYAVWEADRYIYAVTLKNVSNKTIYPRHKDSGELMRDPDQMPLLNADFDQVKNILADVIPPAQLSFLSQSKGYLGIYYWINDQGEILQVSFSINTHSADDKYMRSISPLQFEQIEKRIIESVVCEIPWRAQFVDYLGDSFIVRFQDGLTVSNDIR